MNVVGKGILTPSKSPLPYRSRCKLCGVPAYYVEERVDNLVKRNAVLETVKGKYQTNFIIWSDKYGRINAR